MPEPTVADRRDFLLADLGEGLEEGTIVEWRVAVGDQVELNQVVCIVETAKAEVEVPSPWAGTVVALGGEAGDTIEVGSPLVTIEVAEQPAAGSPGRQPTLVGYGVDESADRSRRTRRSTTDGPARPDRHSRALAKPPVRRRAHELGVDLSELAPGSGPGGIVTMADVGAAARGDTVPRVDAPLSQAVADGTEVIPVRGVRARIAERMTTSAAIPTASASVVADCTRLLEVRTLLDDHGERHGHARVVTPFALLCRFVVQQLAAVPLLNSSFDEEGPEIRVHSAVHLGIGTATDRGLVVTVVRDAHQRAVHDLAAEVARLAEGARAGTLAPAELVGSTFTVSNFGALGIDEGQPLINPPEAAILGVGAIRRRPHVLDDQVVPRATASLTLVFDHRIVDGAEAGRFLSGLRELVEAPELALFGA